MARPVLLLFAARGFRPHNCVFLCLLTPLVEARRILLSSAPVTAVNLLPACSTRWLKLLLLFYYCAGSFPPFRDIQSGAWWLHAALCSARRVRKQRGRCLTETALLQTG